MASADAGKYLSKLHDKTVLILGGTSGIGFAVAEAAWEFGAKVTISGSNQPKIDSKMEQMKSNNPAGNISKLRGYPCDLANRETMEGNLKSLLDFVTDGGNAKLDHIVFCAGDSPKFKPLAEADVEYIQALGLMRFAAPMLIAKLCANHGYLHQSPSSSFTVTGAVNATKPAKGWSIYAAHGGSIEAMARGLAVDMAPIRVNCVAPGAVHTEIFEAFGGPDQLEATLSSFRDRSLTKTVASPEDLAEAYLYCMRDRFVTGSVIASNGGLLLAGFEISTPKPK